MRLLRHAAIVLLVSFTTIGGPLSAAPTAPNATQTIAQTAPSPAPATTATLKGTVVDASSDTPLGGVAIVATGNATNYSTTSAGDGTFSLALPAGIYDIDANKGGFQAGVVSAFAVTAGATSTLRIPLVEAGSSSLRTIGRVSVTRRNSLNLSTSATATLDGAAIQQRELPNLSDTVPELPGVTLLRTTGATANSFFVVRGGDVETKVNIDGHPVSVGTFGNYNTNYAIASIFDQVEVLKGAGLNGPTAGESIFGTVNLRTRDFSPTNYLDVSGGYDNYNGNLYSAFGNVNLLNGKLSLLAGRAFSGFRGPWDNYTANRIGSTGTIPTATYQAPTFPGLIQWQGDLSNRYGLQGELAKARYRFSNSTSLTAEYLGLQGQYIPQGGSYASFEGYATVAPCFNGRTAATDPSQCNGASTYNPPYANNLVGQTVPSYFWFPSSYIQNNEPQFSAELRTSIKNDTVLVRPYTTLVNRFISGDRENRYPGNNGGWFQVTDAANCQATFRGPSTANPSAGAAGPCFANNFAGPAGPAYIGASAPAGVVYSTTAVAPSCSVATPCYTTPTAQQNDGKIGFGTPFSQPEVDRLRGVTFQYLHPVHENLYGFSYDYNSDDTHSTSGDTTDIAAGCSFVIGSATNLQANGTLAQPNCPLATLARTVISIPPTIIRKNDFAGTAQLQLTPKLQTSIGLYFTNYRSAAQVEDPSVLAAFTGTTAAPGIGVGYAPVALVSRTNTVNHLDPHVGFNFRATDNLSLRASGGSSLTLPYASLISGLGSVDKPNGANGQAYTLSLANSSLRPETTVAYDLGLDYRLPDSSIFSVDAYDNTVHNIFAAVTVPTAPVTGIVAPGGYFQSQTINGPIGRYYGLELGLNKSVPLGFGYTFTGSFERAYLDQLPASIYTGSVNLINGKQLDGSVNGQGSIPYAKGYGEIRFAGIRNSLVSFGADYEGANNSTYGPAYVVYNSTVRFEVAPQVAFQMAIENLGNLSTGTALGRAIFNQGSGTLTLAPGPGGTLVAGSVRSKSLQEINPRTLRFTLSHRF